MVIEEKYLAAYFDQQPEYYLKEYQAYHSGSRFTFNAGTFFYSGGWFLYRKLFGLAIATFLLPELILLVAGIVAYVAGANEETILKLQMILILAIRIMMGFIGNFFYIRKADREISKVMANVEGEEERIRTLRKRGGISWSPYVLLVIFVTFLLILKEFIS